MFSIVSILFPQYLSLPKSLQHGPNGFGVGIYMGSPTGLGAINLAHRNKKITRQIYVNWDLQKEQIRGVLDQVWEVYKSKIDDGTQFPVYVGGRGWFRLNDSNVTLGFTGFSNSIGVGIPMGALYQHEEIGVEGYVECAPVLQIAPSFEVGMQVGIGVRFFPSF